MSVPTPESVADPASRESEPTADRPVWSTRPARRYSPLAKLGVAFVVVAACAGTIGFYANRLFESPQQALANSKAPTPSLLTAPVREGSLNNDFVFQGALATRGSVDIGVNAPDAIVTSIDVSPGRTANAGDLVMSLNDAPVFLLRGAVPLYRDLYPGDVGRDVMRLQVAMRDLGFSIFDTTGVYGPSTQRAVSELYRRYGYPVPSAAATPSSDEPIGPTSETTSATSSPSQPPVGPVVGRNAFVLTPRLPATVTKVNVTMGSMNQPAAFTLSSRRLGVDAEVAPLDADRLRPGQKIAISLVSNGRKLGYGRIKAIGKPGPTNDGEGLSSSVTVIPARPLPQRLAGTPVRLSFIADPGSTTGILVPVSAIETSTNGQDSVEVVDGTRRRRVVVTVVGEADGVVQVESDSLRVGQVVVVGTR